MSVGKEVRLKSQSVKNTQKITKAMEMVAASKMRLSQRLMKEAVPYAERAAVMIGHVARGHSEYKHPYMVKRQTKRVGYIVVTSDRGLCGGLNANLLKTTIQAIKKQMDAQIPVDLCLLGHKGMAFFKRVGGNIVAHQRDISDRPNLIDLIGIVKVMLDAYLQEEIDELFICSNQFISTMRQEPRLQQILPLVPSANTQIQHHWDYIYEPDNAPALLETLLTRYIESQVYRAVLENKACEQAARMIAMKNATDNASDLIASLQLIYNKARQAAITRELTEIVAGASVIES